MKNQPAFVNRHAELAFLDSWISESPSSILFIHGPKSSGKTTLLLEFCQRSLSPDKFESKYFNLRELLISNYKDFIRSFFSVDYSKAKGDVRERREYSLHFFRLSVEVLKGIENNELDAFTVMKKQLQAVVARGLRPVIIVDELQALEHIYMNGQRELLKELFNFFVALTKESHLCHVIIASSDGHFVERVYNDSKLKKTSKFLSVDYLQREDVLLWLSDLQSTSNIFDYSLSERQIASIWDALGGSMWEISALLGDLLLLAENGSVADDKLEALIAKKTTAAWALFEDYAGYDQRARALFIALDSAKSAAAAGRIAKSASSLVALVDNGLYSPEELEAAMGELVRHNFISFDPTTASYSVQGRCLELGLQRYAQST